MINWKAVSQKVIDAFFLEIPKEQPEKRLSYGFSQGENWRKRLSFHRAVEMKQPHTMTEPKKKALGGLSFFQEAEPIPVADEQGSGIRGSPGWYGKDQLHDVRVVPGPEDNAIGACEGQGRSDKLHGEGVGREAQGNPAGEPDPEQGRIAPEPQGDAERRPPCPKTEGEGLPSGKGDGQRNGGGLEREPAFQGVASRQQGPGKRIGGQAGRVGAQGKRRGGNGFRIKGPVPKHNGDQRQGYRRQPRRRRQVQAERQQRGPLDFIREGVKRGCRGA